MNACTASAGLPSRAEVTSVCPGAARRPTAAPALRIAAGDPSPSPRKRNGPRTPPAPITALVRSPARPVASQRAITSAAGAPRQESIPADGPDILDRHHDGPGRDGSALGATVQPGEVVGQRPWAVGGNRDQLCVYRQGSAGGGLERFRELSRFVSRQFDHKPATALERYAHHDAAAFLRDLERAITRPRLHRRHPASPSCRETERNYPGTRGTRTLATWRDRPPQP